MTPEEPVGSMAEEAAKLFATLHEWAGDHDDEPLVGECRWCPLCQLVRFAKATSPDVKEHLSQAALSLVLAVKALLQESGTTSGRTMPVEKIDLAEDG